jgi:hypothetical protein
MSLDDAIRELSLEATPPDIKKEKESQNKSFVNIELN